MDLKEQRILVIGAGVNGSAVASSLHNAGINVTVLARGTRFEQVRDEGIIIVDPFKKTRSVTKVPVINLLHPEDIYDFILVIVRKNQVPELLPVLAENKSATIVFMGNNLSGPQELVTALGKDRIMMGSVYAAGRKVGSVIHAVVIRTIATPFGEIDGRITPRLLRLIDLLRKAGFKAKASHNIADTQTTHAVGVALIGSLVMKHGGDVKDLARSKKDLMLFVKARLEGNRVLRATGHKIIPPADALISIIPKSLQVAGFRWLLNSKLGEVGLAWHVSQAPDEMEQLASELRALMNQSGLAAPAIREILGETQVSVENPQKDKV
jgi:2-dehydropantoate 2-reductase